MVFGGNREHKIRFGSLGTFPQKCPVQENDFFLDKWVRKTFL